jgi:hypothetical protein
MVLEARNSTPDPGTAIRGAGAEAEPSHGQGLLEPFPEAGGGARVVRLELASQCPKLLLGPLGIGLPPGLVELAADEGALGLGHEVQHVAALVLTAALDQHPIPEGGL